jgi:cytochrome b
MTEPSPTHRIRVWDAPTRLFHWLLALSVVGLVISGNVGGRWMEWHMRLGYFVISLLLFRLAWGVVGGYWSRFSKFAYRPSSVWAYLRGRSPLIHRVGHSPLGALSVFALLLVLGLQVSTGLLTDDEIFYAGPLTRIASHDTIAWASQYHKGWGKLMLITLVVLHLLALLIYKVVFRQPLVKAMVTGDKALPEAVPSSADHVRAWLLAAVLYALAATATYMIIGLGG